MEITGPVFTDYYYKPCDIQTTMRTTSLLLLCHVVSQGAQHARRVDAAASGAAPEAEAETGPIMSMHARRQPPEQDLVRHATGQQHRPRRRVGTCVGRVWTTTMTMSWGREVG